MSDDKKKGSQMRFSEHELALLRGVFFEQDDLLKLMRKVFLPELDPTAPLGQNIDMWMSLDLNGDPEQVIVNIKARNLLVSHIENRLIEIRSLSNLKTETKEQKEEKAFKSSAK